MLTALAPAKPSPSNSGTTWAEMAENTRPLMASTVAKRAMALRRSGPASGASAASVCNVDVGLAARAFQHQCMDGQADDKMQRGEDQQSVLPANVSER